MSHPLQLGDREKIQDSMNEILSALTRISFNPDTLNQEMQYLLEHCREIQQMMRTLELGRGNHSIWLKCRDIAAQILFLFAIRANFNSRDHISPHVLGIAVACILNPYFLLGKHPEILSDIQRGFNDMVKSESET